MRSKMQAELKQVQSGSKALVAAYRDFSNTFNYMCEDFKTEIYFAECIDLLRKLIMSGVLGLIRRGSILQGFCSVFFGVAFVVLRGCRGGSFFLGLLAFGAGLFWVGFWLVIRE